MTKKQITELTEVQKDAMPEYRDKWIQVGLSCDRVNFEMAKVDLIKAYECAGLPLRLSYSSWACIQDKPLYIKFDDQNRLHCENGPAIEYGDGTVVYAWHGVSVPDAWIADKENALTAEIALTWENIEQRRAACEILGWAKVLEKLNARVVDADEDAQIGTLLRVEIPEIGEEQFLKVQCGTGRTFAIPVPPTVKTALEANAWTYGMDPEQLRDLEVRT